LTAIAALALATACAGGTPTPPSQPTVQAAATSAVGQGASAVGTAQAAASPAAATLQAAASPAAATAQAGASGITASGAAVSETAIAAVRSVASPSPSPSPAALGSQGSQGALRISDASLADATPWLSIQNTSNEAVELGGWHLQVGAANAPLPEEATVEPGGTLTLHAGDGLDNGDEVYLGAAGDALASAALPGAAVRLTDERGQVVTEVTVPRF
jgi:hypothetical protein